MAEYPGPPQSETLSSREGNPKKRHCIFIPGMQATNAWMNAEMGIGQGLVKAYGEGNVTIFNSIISTDTPNKKRFEQMSTAIKKQVQQGGVDIAVHSLGVAELSYVLRMIRKDKEDPTYFDDQKVKDNLRIVVIGPSGFNKGLKDKFDYARQVSALNGRKAKGFDALTAFPPKGVTPEQLTEIFSDSSNITEGFRVVPFMPDRTNIEFLSQKDKEMLNVYDKELQDLVLLNWKKDLEEAAEERAGVVKGPLQQVFEGTPVKDRSPRGRVRVGGITGLGILIRAAGKKPMEELQAMAKMGYQVDFLVPEYDFVVPLQKVMKFFEGQESEAKKHVEIMQQSSHPAISLQSEIYGRAIRGEGSEAK